mgnify:CR=1 FL=1
MFVSYINLEPQHKVAIVETINTTTVEARPTTTNIINKSEVDRVEIRHKQKGRFLALVPVVFDVVVRVGADRTIDIRYPWYSVLTIDHQEEVETKVKIAVDNALGSASIGSVRGEGKAEHPTFSEGERSAIFERVNGVLADALEEQGG